MLIIGIAGGSGSGKTTVVKAITDKLHDKVTVIPQDSYYTKVGMIKPYQKFQAEIYVLKKDEGGRHTPFHNHYRPQFFIRTLDITGEISLPEGVEMVMPGDNVTITVELIYPVAINEGLQFAIREGGRTVGAGQVTKLID